VLQSIQIPKGPIVPIIDEVLGADAMIQEELRVLQLVWAGDSAVVGALGF
jgi:hypothetical protein